MNKNFIFIILAVLVSFNSCFAATNEQKASVQSVSVQKNSASYTAEASDKFMKQDFNGAIKLLSLAIQQNPNNPQLYLNRGFVKHIMLDYKGAMDDYNNSLKINPNFAYGYNNRGVLKVAMNDTKGAMDDYEKALSINPKYSDVYYNRGNLKYMLNDNKGALADYDLAIKYNPKDSEAYNNRGVVKKRMNYNVGALSDYSQAIALNPQDSIAFANRGRLKKLYFDNDGAAIDLNKAVELAENQVFIKNVKPLLSNQSYIAAIPTAKGIVRTSGEVNINHSEKINTVGVGAGAKVGANNNSSNNNTKVNAEVNSRVSATINSSINNKKIAGENTRIAKAIVPNETQKQQNPKPAMAKDIKDTVSKPVQKSAQVASTASAKDNKQLSSKSTGNKNSSSSTLISAGVGKVATPVVPDIRTSQVTQKATTNTKLAESYYIRGLQKCVLRDMQGAIADLDKAISNNSSYADAYYYRAAIKKELGDKDGFRQDYSKAIQLNPKLQAYNDSDVLSMVGI